MLLNNKNAVITGARTGIGKATVDLFAHNGANIWACIRKQDSKFEEYVKALSEKNNVWIEIIYMDLDDESKIKESTKEIIKSKKNIDILVNSAGIVGENRIFHMTNLKEMRRVFETNFFSSILLTQLITRVMCKQLKNCPQKYSSIVNVSSVAGIDGDPGQMEYSASKAAMINATKKLAIELGKDNIRVNSVAPGLTDTKMLNTMSDEMEQKTLKNVIMKRKAKPAEIANAIMFLASDMASYITGQTIRVDGGIV